MQDTEAIEIEEPVSLGTSEFVSELTTYISGFVKFVANRALGGD